MNVLLQDLRYGLRSLGHRPGFALVAIVTLALGIGLNAAVFTVVDAALVRSVPYAEPERLVHLWQVQDDAERRHFPFATADTPGPRGNDVREAACRLQHRGARRSTDGQ